MPARLAVGLGLESDLARCYQQAFAPAQFCWAFGSPAPGLPSFGCVWGNHNIFQLFKPKSDAPHLPLDLPNPLSRYLWAA